MTNRLTRVGEMDASPFLSRNFPFLNVVFVIHSIPSFICPALHLLTCSTKPFFIALSSCILSLSSVQSNFMASTSSNREIEESALSTSTSGGSMPAFLRFEPPTTKLTFQNDRRYHVFLSFRGSDVRNTLVDHLSEALSTAGLNVFLDSDKLEKGEMVWESLEKAIKSSAVRIPIFSTGYANSAWCLKEAAAMLSFPGFIIPLFYHVDPTHVRYPLQESSPYNQAFLKHYDHPDRQSREEVDEWKNALLQICCRSGWSMDITGG